MSRPALKSSQPHPGFVSWKAYPADQDFDAKLLNFNEYKERLTADSNRLFVSDSDSRLEILGIGQADPESQIIGQENFTSAVRFDQELSRISTKKNLRVFYITQAFSWGRLLISEDHFLKLFTFLRVCPLFLDIVHTSGEKIVPVEESFTSQFTQLLPSPSGPDGSVLRPGYELGYSIKYVERHGRRHSADPFSLRETGVYQKWDAESQSGNWIFLQPSKSARSQFESTFQSSPDEDSAYLFHVHATILLQASRNWRYYINHLEDMFSKLVDKGFFTNVRGPSHSGDINTNFSDIRKLQVLQEKLRRLSQILDLNMEVALALQDFFERLRAAWLPFERSESAAADSSAHFEQFQSQIKQFLFQHRTHKSRIASMLDRGEGLSTLSRTILNFRDAEASNRIIESIRDLTLQSVSENRSLEKISQSAAQDTRAMMIITLVTTIFLPATFVATLFGSNFFGFAATENDGNQLRVAGNIWIYVVTTLVLLVITVGSGWLCWRRLRTHHNSTTANDGDGKPMDLESGRV